VKKKKVFVLLGPRFLPNQFKSVTHYLNNVIVEVRLEVIVLTAYSRLERGRKIIQLKFLVFHFLMTIVCGKGTLVSFIPVVW